MAHKECVQTLEENSAEVYLETTTVLLKLVDNVLKNPSNPKYRCIRLGNPTVAAKLIPAIGAMECLFEMGFQEGDDSLVLPEHIALEKLISVRDEILSRREQYLKALSTSKERQEACSRDPGTTVANLGTTVANPGMIVANSRESTVGRRMEPKQQEIKVEQDMHSLELTLRRNFKHVLLYENPALQIKALDCIPVSDLEKAAERKMRKIQKSDSAAEAEGEADIRDILLVELLYWFKNSFFQWVDSPQCKQCKGSTRFVGASSDPEETAGTDRVEVFLCDSCNGKELFPRISDPGRLLDTRQGRCGEWANCFTLICRAMKYDARYVVDVTDHVWTEVYSISQKRWLHCDPCENVCDSPLMYESGWGKKLSYVIAYSKDEIQDVTWRYSSKHQEVLRRRRKCSEEWLLFTILKLRQERQVDFSKAKKDYLNKRLIVELVEFLTPRNPRENEHQGRHSGSLAWRMARGEIGSSASIVPYTWTPTERERQSRELHIVYTPVSDKYVRVSDENVEISNWTSGVYHGESVFRKEEKDWKMVYLARTENGEKGIIKWRFDFRSSGLVIDHIKLVCHSSVFETGKVTWLLCCDDCCVRVPTGSTPFESKEFGGSKEVILSAELSGGVGDVAWQHAQLFRCKTNASDSDYPFEVHITLRK